MGAEAQICQDHKPLTGVAGTRALTDGDRTPRGDRPCKRAAPGAWAPKSGQGAVQPERLRQRQRHRQKDRPKDGGAEARRGGKRERRAGRAFSGEARRDAGGCLPASGYPGRDGAPQNQRARGTPGRGGDEVGCSHGLTLPARPALARRGAERSRGRGARAPTGSLARSAAVSSPPARPAAFKAAAPPPATPPALPAPHLPLPPSLRPAPDSSTRAQPRLLGQEAARPELSASWC